jgi:hypothetical protein
MYWLISLSLAQEVSLHVDEDKHYAGLPFVLTILATDFEEEPVPDVSKFSINGCKTQFLGMEPQITRRVSLVNGQYSEQTDVRYAYQYRVLANKKGEYQIPSISVSQDDLEIKTRVSKFSVLAVPRTTDMEIEVSFDEGRYWIGQEIPVYVDLYLRKDISDQEISVPLFDLFPTRSLNPQERGLSLLTKFGEVHLPLSQEKINRKGQQITRVRLSSIIELNQAGRFEVEPAKIFANIAMGRSRGSFGRSKTQYSSFQASDRIRKIEVKPLPLLNRPVSFSGAVGKGFVLKVSASRTVVGLGEPVSLRFQIKGNGDLNGIQLPKLKTMGLDERIFGLPSTASIGVIQDDGSKLFTMNIYLKSTSVREIPALEFSFFNPKTGKYQQARSEPIALSVKDTVQISSVDVFSARGKTMGSRSKEKDADKAIGGEIGSMSGADLSLSAPNLSLEESLDSKLVWWIAGLGHLFALLFLGFSGWWSRGKETRQEKGERTNCKNRLHKAIQEAKTEPAAKIAKELGLSIKALEKEFGVDCQDELARIEIESFAPSAITLPLSAQMLESLEEKLQNTVKLLVPLILVFGFGMEAKAEEISVSALQEEYHQVLQIEDRVEKAQGFSKLLQRYKQVVKEHPNSPELHTDWGNVALGNSDFGTAAFAYHRALDLKPRLKRAKQNSLWIEAQLPDWAQSDRDSDPLLWGEVLSEAERLVLVTGIFILLIVMLRSRRFTFCGILGLVWCSLVLSVTIEQFVPESVFVSKTEALLRTADSEGAGLVMSKELPRGTKLTVLNAHGDWLQVSLDSGEKGWLSISSVYSIIEERK